MSTTLERLYTPGEISLGSLRPHPKNPRHDVDDALVASIREQGVLLPIVIAPPIGSDAAYVIIDGHRRAAGAKAAGLATIPATLREDLDTPAKQLAAMLVANGDRLDLTVREEAEAFQQLLDYGMTVTKAAKATGRKAAQVKQLTAVAALPDKVLAKAHSGQVSFEAAAALAQYVGTEHYDELERAAGTNNWGFTLASVESRILKEEAWTLVQQHAAEHGWTLTLGYEGCGPTVLEAYSVRSIDRLREQLAALDGPHVVRGQGGYWSVCTPAKPRDPDDKDDERTARRAEWEIEAAARREREEHLNTARTPRRQWLIARLKQLAVKDSERAALLRVLLLDLLEVMDGGDAEDAELAGLPTAKDEDDQAVVAEQADLEAWVDGANENRLWKALLTLQFRVGDERLYSESAHRLEIRLAAALGYQPSDIERDLITPGVKA